MSFSLAPLLKMLKAAIFGGGLCKLSAVCSGRESLAPDYRDNGNQGCKVHWTRNQGRVLEAFRTRPRGSRVSCTTVHSKYFQAVNRMKSRYLSQVVAPQPITNHSQNKLKHFNPWT